MNYVLRVWVDDKLEETLETEDVEQAKARFRAIVAEWPNDWPNVRWYVSVVEEPDRPERSFEIARYPHTPTK